MWYASDGKELEGTRGRDIGKGLRGMREKIEAGWYEMVERKVEPECLKKIKKEEQNK